MIKIPTEAGYVEVTSKEQAIRIIQNTAHVEVVTTLEGLEAIPKVKELAEHFNFSLEHFKRTCEEDILGHANGYGPHAIKYTEGENNWQYIPTVILMFSDEWEEINSESDLAKDYIDYVLAHITSLPEESKEYVHVERISHDINTEINEVIKHINANKITVLVTPDLESYEILETYLRTKIMPTYFNSNFATIEYDDINECAKIGIVSTEISNPIMHEITLLGRYFDVAPFIKEVYDL